MADRSYLSWPFFEARHRELADALARFCATMHHDEGDLDEACRRLVRELGASGLLKLSVADGDRRTAGRG